MKLRLFIKSFNQSLLKETLEELTAILANSDCQILSVVSLPVTLKRFCVLRSPHVDKDSREHFEVRVYKQFIDIHVKNPAGLDLLFFSFYLPSGVSCFLRYC